MSRRKKRSKKAKKTAPPPRDEPPAVEVRPPRPRKWFLAATIGLEAAWLVFLLILGTTRG